MVQVDLFERQLHIAVLVVVIDIFAPIMHRQIFHDGYRWAALLMLEVVGDKYRDLKKFL